MASRDNKGWRLKPVTPMDYDPHLQEQKLAEPHQLSHILTSQGQDGITYVDVIARLKNEKGARPDALQVLRNPGQSDILTGRVALDKIEEVRGHANIASLKAATELFLDLHLSVPAIQADPRALQEALQLPGLDGSGVILGVVDLGCDFRHQNFRRPTGETRLLYLWDQSEPPEGNTVAPPKGFGYGREFTDAKINEALFQKRMPAYSALGYTPLIGSHGTHVLDIAAGNGREPNSLGGKPGSDPEERSPRGVAPGADLIFVHLKCGAHNCLGNSRHLLEAVEYIFGKARELGRPAVVNLSLATSGGPHDGTTLVEQGFERLLREPGRAIVVSAGNAFAKDTHVQGTAPDELRWRTDPRADKSEMEIWYSRDQALKVIVTTPSQIELPPVKLGDTREIYMDDERRGRISHRKNDPNNNDNQIDIRIFRPKGEEQQAETWTVRLEAEKGKKVPFHAWIEQDDQGSSRFEGETNPSHTLGSICCGKNLITVGAYDTFERAYLALPYEATAAGPTRKGNEDKPDVSAPGVAILAARAQGGTTIMSGTSMAAPHVAGLVALVFQVAQRLGLGLLTIEETREVILGSARPVNSSQKGWDSRFGWGRIDGVEALKRLQEIQAKRKPRLAPEAGFASAEPLNGKPDLSDELRQLRELLAKHVGSGIEIQLKAKGNGNGHHPPRTPPPPAARGKVSSKGSGRPAR